MTRIRFYGSGPEPNLSRVSGPPVNNGRTLGALTQRSSVACANDQTTNPDLERFLAKRMKATTIELPSSHVSMISHPKAIVNLIIRAAG